MVCWYSLNTKLLREAMIRTDTWVSSYGVPGTDLPYMVAYLHNQRPSDASFIHFPNQNLWVARFAKTFRRLLALSVRKRGVAVSPHVQVGVYLQHIVIYSTS